MSISRIRRAGAALVAAGSLAIASGCGGSDEGSSAAASADRPPDASSVPLIAPADRGPGLLRGSIEMIDGERLALSRLRGSVVLAVNTASRCGYTPQFEGLESLFRAKAASGFTIVGFPSNDFRQELAKDGAIADFCTLNYGVSFPMAARSRVTGPKANALFAAIAARPAPAGEEPAWNFTKYLIDRSGRLVARYPSSVEPDDPGLRGAVDRLLEEDRGL